MKSVRWFALFFLPWLTISAYGQSNSVEQSGPISPGHVPVFVTNGVIGDGGVSTNGNINTFGITSSSGIPFCLQDTQIHTGPYRQFCFGLTSSGANIYLTPYGGEANQTLNFVINGVTIPFPQPIPPPPIAATPLRTVTSGSTDTATILDANGTVAWNSSSALAKTETLPTCNFAANGFTVAIKDEIGTAGTYPITITGAQTLDGQAVYIMAFNHQATAFQCDSTESNWVVK